MASGDNVTGRLTPSHLEEETRLLDELAGLLRQSREMRPDHGPLSQILERQAALCETLANHRTARATQLEALGYGPRDLLVAVLAGTAKEEHEGAVASFGGFVEAAERVQTQIDINREFFSVALAAVEDALTAASPDNGRSATYDRSGISRRPSGSVMISTVT